ncbi:MAG: protein-disulfide reductase DsbD family protein [Acidobacteriaceae bacterium]
MYRPRFSSLARWLIVLAAALLLLHKTCAAAQTISAQSVSAPHVKVELLADTTSVNRTGQDFQLGLHFQLDPGWHIYWQNAGDSGEPPRVQWKLPAFMPVGDIGPMQFPVPQRLPLGPLMDFGYEKEVLFPFAVHFLPTGVAAGHTLPIGANIRWLVCSQVCIPGKGTVALTLPLQSGTGKANPQTAAIFQHAQQTLPRPLPADASITVTQNARQLILTVHGLRGLPQGHGVAGVEFYPFEQYLIANAAPQKIKPLADGLRIQVQKDPNAPALQQLHGLLKLPDGTGYAFTAPIAASASAPPAPEQGMARIVFLAFLGGILLNLMPCVFPVLFIKGLALVRSSTEERKHLRLHGLMYTLGILVSFWAIVAVLLLLRAGGSHIGWGFQFQSPIFVSFIALLLFFLGLSLAGQFEIGLSLTSAGGALAQKRGHTGSFFTGVLATVVATPCAAPFLGVAIGYALVQPALVTFLIFTALALGLAAPYLLLTLQPAWTRLLPRPGVWMEYLKQATAIPIFGTVIWLVWVFAQVAGQNAVAFLLAGFLLVAIAGWALGRWPARAVSTVVAILLLALAAWLPITAARHLATPTGHANATSTGSLQWQPYSAQALASYRAQGKAVFVDFTAAWCLSCQVNERVVLDRNDVQQAFRSSGVVLMRADWTNHDDAITEALAQLGRSSVPDYALYTGGPSNSPHMLPEVLTPGIVLDALRSVTPTAQK